MNPIELPREIQDLVSLRDDEIRDHLKQSTKLVEIFHKLKKDQVSHVEKPLADRFVHIIEETDIDSSIKHSIIGVFRDVGGIGTDLLESQLDDMLLGYSPGELISNWPYFTENNKKLILFILIKRNDFGNLQELIKKTGVNLNVFTEDGTPFLQYAYVQLMRQKETLPLVFNNRKEFIKSFIEKGADPNAMSGGGETLLEKVIIHGDDFVLAEVVQLGAKPNVLNRQGVPLVHLAYLLSMDRPESSSDAENEKYKKVFDILVSINDTDLAAVDRHAHNLFELAYGRGDLSTIDRFLKHPSISEEDRNGYLLMIAYQEGKWDEVKKLLKKGSINLTVKNSLGITPLHYISSKNLYPKLVKALLMRLRPDVNVKDYAGDTPLFMAFANGDIDLIKTLLALGAEQDVIGSQGDTPLHRAYLLNQNFLFTQLFKQRLFNPNVRDARGRTLLQLAFLDGNRRFLKILLKQPSVDLYFQDENGEHVIDMASFLSDSEIMKAFLENSTLKKADKNGYKLLIACRRRDWRAALQILQENEINPNFKDGSGNTPLWMAYQAKNIDVVQALLERDEIDPNISDAMVNPFIFSVYKNYQLAAAGSQPFYKKTIQSLLECKNIDLNLKNNRGKSLLHVAYFHKDKKFFQELLGDERVNPNCLDANGRTLLASAYEKSDDETFDMLLANPRVNPNVYLENGRPLLVEAFLRNDMELVNRLLEDSRTDPNVKDKEGRTILYLALEKLNKDLVERLFHNKKVDPNVCTKQGDLIFDALLLFDLRKNRITIHSYAPNKPSPMMALFLQHPKMTKADRNGYKLYIALFADKLDHVKEIFSEQEINLNVKYCYGIAVLNKRFEIVQELLRRGAELKTNHLLQVCKMNERELARVFFDAGCSFNPRDPVDGKHILTVLFPNWDWNVILKNPSKSMMAIFTDPANISRFLIVGAKDVNPLELFLVFPNSKLYIEYLASLTERQRNQYLNGIKKMYPNQALFLGLETIFTPPEKPKRNLPEIKNFSLEKAVSIYKRHYGYINFSDIKKPGYIPPNMILDQGVRCSELKLRQYGEAFCLYIMDPTKSKFTQEKKDSQSYQRLREKFRYVMYHVAEEHERLETDTKLTGDEKARIKKNIDNLLMLIASSGNHCILAKNDVLEEGLDNAYGVAYVPTLINQIALIVHRYRLGIIEKMFTDNDIDPPQILTHEMYAFMVRYKDQLGVLMEDLVEDDPFMQGVQLDPSFIGNYEKKNTPDKLVHVIASELQGSNPEVTPESFRKWLSENPPQEWNQFDELLFDLEHLPEDLGYAYLYRNFAISPTPEEMLQLAPSSKQEIHREKLKEISFQVSQEYEEIKRKKELEAKRMREALEGMEGLQKIQMQEEINALRIDIPFLSAKKIEEQKRRKMAYLKEHGVFISPKEYLLDLKNKEDISVIKKQMQGKPLEVQWEILSHHNIILASPFEVLGDSDKVDDEINKIVIELDGKPEEEQWEVLAHHRIPNPNPKTPLEALEKYRAQQYANQSYLDSLVRVNRIIPLLMFAKQLQFFSS